MQAMDRPSTHIGIGGGECVLFLCTAIGIWWCSAAAAYSQSADLNALKQSLQQLQRQMTEEEDRIQSLRERQQALIRQREQEQQRREEETARRRQASETLKAARSNPAIGSQRSLDPSTLGTAFPTRLEPLPGRTGRGLAPRPAPWSSRGGQDSAPRAQNEVSPALTVGPHAAWDSSAAMPPGRPMGHMGEQAPSGGRSDEGIGGQDREQLRRKALEVARDFAKQKRSEYAKTSSNRGSVGKPTSGEKPQRPRLFKPRRKKEAGGSSGR